MSPIVLLVALLSFPLFFRFPLLGLVVVLAENQVEFLFSGDNPQISFGRVLGMALVLAWALRKASSRNTRLDFGNRPTVLVAVYVSILVLSTATAQYPQEGISSVLKIAILAVLFVLVQDLVRSERDLEFLALGIGISYGLATLAGAYQFQSWAAGGEFLGTTTGHLDSARFAGFRDNPNSYGFAIMSGLPFLLFLTREAKQRFVRPLLAILFVMGVFSLYLTASRTHVYSLFAFILAYFYILFRKHVSVPTVTVFVLVLASLLLLWRQLPEHTTFRLTGAVFGPEQSIGTRRAFMEKSILLMYSGKTLGWGLGLGNFKRYPPMQGMDPHDTFSFSTSETGLVGTAALLLIVVGASIRLHRSVGSFRKSDDPRLLHLAATVQAAFLAMLISGFGNVFVYRRLFWIYLGLSLVLPRVARLKLARSQ